MSETPVVIATPSLWCVGTDLGAMRQVTFDGGTAWPLANRALCVPLYIPETLTAVQLLSYNGVGAGNIDMGVYDRDGARIVSSGAAAMGNNVAQGHDIADTDLAPGRYYLAISLSNVAGVIVRLAGVISRARASGVLQADAAHPLPANLTLAALTSDFVPFIGLSTRTLV